MIVSTALSASALGWVLLVQVLTMGQDSCRFWLCFFASILR